VTTSAQKSPIQLLKQKEQPMDNQNKDLRNEKRSRERLKKRFLILVRV
jgi:hypothetical protein